MEDAYHHYRHILHCYRCKERGRHEVAWLCALSHSLPNEVIKSVLHCQLGDHSFPLNYRYCITEYLQFSRTIILPQK